MSASRWVTLFLMLVAALGFLLPLWPLCVLGVALLSLWGRWFVALVVGLLLDLAWGAPVGLAHFLYFPFTATAVVAALARFVGSRYLINRDLPERL
jgi:hypothetical protein